MRQGFLENIWGKKGLKSVVMYKFVIIYKLKKIVEEIKVCIYISY